MTLIKLETKMDDMNNEGRSITKAAIQAFYRPQTSY